jgi:hypothetical protein
MQATLPASPRYIVAIFPDGKEEAQCIRVAHPSGVYLTDHYIPTHNSSGPDNPPTGPSKASLRETERAYGGREAYERAKAAGRTKLDYPQWVQVRTDEFKSGFGDWEALLHQKFLNGKPVSTLTGKEFTLGGTKLTDEVSQWYADNGYS